MSDSKVYTTSHAKKEKLLLLAFGTLGIVYGDIGTSPLYALRECFHGTHSVAPTVGNILGVLSLTFWSLTMVVSIKYILFIMRADNRGEGGIFSLLALVPSDPAKISKWGKTAVVLVGLLGASLLYGDGIITPAISVLSAVEGLKVATSAAEPAVVPITCLVLFILFLIQRHGTGRISNVFAPVMFVWFIVIGALGLVEIQKTPKVLFALNPEYAVQFFKENGFHGFLVLGAVILVITGGEALYADMGHFGKKPIRLTWFCLVFPSLLLNYFGQGAFLLNHPDFSEPFYGLVPKPLLYPMVALATMATIIASQAMITGVFSLTRQAVQLGFWPRVHIVHTSGETQGQIYIPSTNMFLMITCIGLVLFFGASGKLAAAYGVAVTADMTITSLIFFVVITKTWKWGIERALPLLLIFLLFDLSFLGSNLFKLHAGGWFPVFVAVVIMTLMTTWNRGRKELSERIVSAIIPVELFLEDVERTKPPRVEGTAVFMSSMTSGVPPVLLHHFKHNHVLHKQVVLLSIQVADAPFVTKHERLRLEELGHGFYRLVAHNGFMENPNVPEVMRRAYRLGLATNPESTSYYLGRETLLTEGKSNMMKWRKRLFRFISRNATNPTAYYGIPPGRVIELGMQINL
jgi:KUP system potassium uptake protein